MRDWTQLPNITHKNFFQIYFGDFRFLAYGLLLYIGMKANETINNRENKMSDLREFKVGETYESRSICDHNCVFSFTILRRSARSVWVEVDGKVVRRGIEIYRDAETFYPFGKYSMAAIIKA